MPQMAPMLWLILFFYFIILFMMYISNFYYTYLPSAPVGSVTSGEPTKGLNWMW